MGDLALTLPFGLAKRQKLNPRAMAQEMMARLGPLPGRRADGSGRRRLSSTSSWTRTPSSPRACAAAGTTALRPDERKVIVEHTNINPNKAAHIGHLRNACLGDTLVRCLRFKGETVEAQNYIDDTGVQVVDVVFGFLELEKKSLADLERDRALRLLLLGPLRPDGRLPGRPTRRPRPARPRSSRPSSTARARRGPWPATSPGASCGPTWRP